MNAIPKTMFSDPAPVPSPVLRNYPAGVCLLNRNVFHIDRTVSLAPSDVENWLLDQANKVADTTALIEGFGARLVQAGLGVARLGLNVGTLHPQALGYAWNWNILDGFCDEIMLNEGVLSMDAYRSSPLYRTMEFGAQVQISLESERPERDGALMTELAEAGFTEYLAVPLPTRKTRSNAVTLATLQPGGFTDLQKHTLHRLLKIFALHVERHVAERITENISRAYLGREAAQRVVSGTIKRGGGRPIRAIVWSSDMRGFSGLSETMDNQITAQMLDRYFSVMADAVIKHGGDVIKFIGDGMLAVFLLEDFEAPEMAAKAAATSAREAVALLDALNLEMQDYPDWAHLQTGIGLHLGEVFFGNIGSAKRLDFTVIGEAVNIASRIEGFCKPLNRNILMSAPVASLLHESFEDMGTQRLNGISRTENLFALGE